METTDSRMPSQEIVIPLPGVNLGGELNLPSTTSGLVLFAHGSGSSRHSPRNQFVARTLRSAGVGTLLFDLLTADEERAEARTRHLRFNIPFLAQRLVGATRWAFEQSTVRGLKAGYFGSSTGAAAALVAAAELGDTQVIPLNEEAYARLPCQKELRIVPGASHLFEEPGTLEQVAQMASEWFAHHLQSQPS